MTNARTARQNTREKAAAMRLEQAALERRRRIAWVSAGVAGVLIVGGGITAAVMFGARGTGPGDGLGTVQTFAEEKNHVSGMVSYAQMPPAGGDHSAVWLNCGIYTAPVSNENAVHDLEHGAVWITYRSTLPAEEVARLVAFVRGRNVDVDPHVLLSPYPGIAAPVVVSAWGVQLPLTGAGDPRLKAFVAKYERNPQAPEATGSCSGGTGTPNG